MNARRLAVTETNMAYRTADHLRWQGLNFVTGIEVRLSNNHNCKGYRKGTFRDICDDLQGRYPKDFKFTGWHPHCRCVAVPILKKPEEVAEDTQRILQGKEPLPASDSPEAVKTMPEAFTDWTKRNADRIEAARAKGTLPYFLKDNEGLLSGGKSVSKNKAKPNTRAKASAKVKKTAELTAAPASLDHLATSLGIKVGKPMTFEQADHKRGNPYRKGTRTDPYSINCQSCVVAYEARLRGLDVAAMPNFKRPGTAPTLLARDMTLAWKDPKTGKRPVIRFGTEAMGEGGYRLVGAANFKRSMERLDDATAEKGRYLIVVLWRGRGGHVFSLERKADGTLFSFDPQTGESGVLRQYLRRAVPGFELLRIDTLEFDTDIASRVLIKQSAPRLASFSKASKAKGGVLGAPKKQGKLVTSEERKAFALKSKNERDKFDKEQRMCKVLADYGHNVRHLSDKGGGCDIELDGIPYDLKSTRSANNIAKYAKYAVREQGAKGVVFEFEKRTDKIMIELDALVRKHDIHGYYYFKNENKLYKF